VPPCLLLPAEVLALQLACLLQQGVPESRLAHPQVPLRTGETLQVLQQHSVAPAMLSAGSIYYLQTS
jgi:hypothetical protein